jgi:hypothetical protein
VSVWASVVALRGGASSSIGFQLGSACEISITAADRWAVAFSNVSCIQAMLA